MDLITYSSMDEIIKDIISKLRYNGITVFYFTKFFIEETGQKAPMIRVRDARSESDVPEELIGLALICGNLFFIFNIYGRTELISVNNENTTPYSITNKLDTVKCIKRMFDEIEFDRGNLPQ